VLFFLPFTAILENSLLISPGVIHKFGAAFKYKTKGFFNKEECESNDGEQFIAPNRVL